MSIATADENVCFQGTPPKIWFQLKKKDLTPHRQNSVDQLYTQSRTHEILTMLKKKPPPSRVNLLPASETVKGTNIVILET